MKCLFSWGFVFLRSCILIFIVSGLVMSVFYNLLSPSWPIRALADCRAGDFPVPNGKQMLFMLIFSQRTLAELWAKQSVWGEMCRFTPRVRPNSNLQEWAWKRCKYCGHLKTSWNYMVPRLDQFSVAEQCSAGCSHDAFAKASVSFCKEIHQWSKFAS